MKAPFAPLCTRLLRLAPKYTTPRAKLPPLLPPPLRAMHPAAPPLAAARPIDDPPFLDPEEFAHVVAQLGDARTSAQKRETLLRLIGIDPAQTVPVPSTETDGDGAGPSTLKSAEEKKEAESKNEQEVAGHDEPAAAEHDVGEHEAPQSESVVPRRLPGPARPASQLAPAPSESGRDAGGGKKHARSAPDNNETGSCSSCSDAQAGSGRADDTRPAKVARPCARERLAG